MGRGRCAAVPGARSARAAASQSSTEGAPTGVRARIPTGPDDDSLRLLRAATASRGSSSRHSRRVVGEDPAQCSPLRPLRSHPVQGRHPEASRGSISQIQQPDISRCRPRRTKSGNAGAPIPIIPCARVSGRRTAEGGAQAVDGSWRKDARTARGAMMQTSHLTQTRVSYRPHRSSRAFEISPTVARARTASTINGIRCGRSPEGDP